MRAGGHGGYRNIHFDQEHRQLIFTSVGGSGAAHVFGVGGSLSTSSDRTPSNYVPVWQPPPTRNVLEPAAVVPAPARPIEDEEEEPMSHTWGHVFRQAAGGIVGMIGGGSAFPDYGGMVGGGAGGDVPLGVGMATEAPGVSGGLGAESCEGMIWSGGTPPKGYKVVNSCGVGVLRKVRRRRRRRLLTASDKADISYIVATTGKGQLAASLIHRSAQ